MLDTFKARLKAYLKAAGVNLSTKRIDAYADRLHKKNPDVKDEAEHDTLIKDLDELVGFAEIAKDDDTIRTKDAQIKKLSEKKPDPKDEDEEDEDNDDEHAETNKGKKKQDKDQPGRMPKWFKTYADKIDSMVGEKSQATIKSLIAAKLKGEDGKTKIPEDFYDEWKLPEKEDQIEDFVAKIEAKWSVIHPASETTETKPVNGHKPNRSSKPSATATEKEVDDIADRILGPAPTKS